MAVIFTISLILCHFMIHDLSKQYDLKSHCETTNIGDEEQDGTVDDRTTDDRTTDDRMTDDLKSSCENNNSGDVETDGRTRDDRTRDDRMIDDDHATNGHATNGHDTYRHTANVIINDTFETSPLLPGEKKIELLWFIREMFVNYDTSLILIVSFFETFLVLSAHVCIPIIVVDILKWPVSALNYILLSVGLCSILPCFILIWKTFTDIQVFYMSLVSICAYGVVQVIQIVFVFYSRNFIINVVLSVVFCLLFSNVMIIKDVFLRGFLAKMISSKYQSLGDSVRLTASRIGSITALLSAPFALEQIDIIGWIYIGALLFLGILLLVRRKTLGNPKIIIH